MDVLNLITELVKENKKLEQQVGTLKLELEYMQGLHKRDFNKQLEMQTEINQLKEVNKKLKEDLADETMARKDLSDEFQKMQIRCCDYARDVTRLNLSIHNINDDANKKIKELEEELRLTKEEIKVLGYKQCSGISCDLLTENEELKKEREEYIERTARLATRNSHLNEENRELKDELDRIRRILKELSNAD